MVVGLALAAVQMGMALPTGFLFGVGYGTGVRIGYEQVYPLLFPKGARPTTTELAATMKGMNTVYDAIGGKDASRMGIAVGITNAGEILNNPDFRVLEQLELSSSGLTSSSSNRSRYGLDQESPQEAVSSDIDKFNQENPSDVEKLDRYRGYTITQLRNIITSTTNAQSKRLATLVLNEKLQANQGTGTTTTATSPPINQQPFPGQKDVDKPEAVAWLKLRDQHINNYHIQRVQSDVGNSVHRSRARSAMKSSITVLRNLSNDYRNPNNFIRTQALILRRLILKLIS